MRLEEFEQFADADRMKTLFQQRLQRFCPKQSLITQCEIFRTRFRPYFDSKSLGKPSLSATYRLKIKDNVGERFQTLYARCYLEGHSKYEFQKVQEIIPATSDLNDLLIHLPDLNTILWTFPNDPRLPYLPWLVDAERVKRYLPYEHLPEDVNSPKDVRTITVDSIRYHPENRCTNRYRLQWGPPSASKALTLFGKTYRNDRGETVHRYMERLWRESTKTRNGFLIARPLGYHKTVKTVWQEGLSGTPLVDRLDQTNYSDYVESIAIALANLHQSGLSSLIKTGLDDHLTIIRSKANHLVQVLPHLKKPLFAAIHNIEDKMSGFRRIPVKPVHGAFRISQLLEHAGKFALFDFDGFAMGDPLQDLADFIVDSQFRGLDPPLVNQIIRGLFLSYRLRVPWEVPRERLNWHIQVQFINNAYRCSRTQKAGFLDIIEYSIVHAQRDCIEYMESRVL